MAYTPDDFGPGTAGPQIELLRERLDAHGVPPAWSAEDEARVAYWQRTQGWTGAGADGQVGPVTLRRLLAAPPHAPAGIDLSRFKVTLPIGDPDEIYPIGTHESAPWFVNHGPAGITFRAKVDGATTSNTGYARSELREMELDGSRADWSNDDETHRMSGTCAVTELPGGKRELVVAQIHDAGDDVVMLLVSGDRVYASWSKGKDQGSERVLLFSGYKLGDRLTHTITASPEGIAVVANGYRSDKQKLIDGAYFKAGCYLQANEVTGTGYGEVVYYALSL